MIIIKRDRALKGMLGGDGSLQLTASSLQWSSSRHDEFSQGAAEIIIPLDQIISIKKSGYMPGYPILYHVFFFPAPWIAKGLAAILNIFFKRWIQVDTPKQRYRFNVSEQDEWIEAINQTRSSLRVTGALP